MINAIIHRDYRQWRDDSDCVRDPRGGWSFRANRAHGDDLPGDAYEYLMRHFATQ